LLIENLNGEVSTFSQQSEINNQHSGHMRRICLASQRRLGGGLSM
jgi:hypothetical protein